MKVVVVGIDGGTWDIVRKYLRDLPNFARFVEAGVHGTLETCQPPCTYPAWKCYSSGLNPAKFGVFFFLTVDFERKKFVFHTSKSFRCKEVWDYLGEHGYQVGIVNMPTTYPPRAVNGVMVAYPVLPRDYTYPRELQATIEKKYDYHPYTSFVDLRLIREHTHREKIMKKIERCVQSRFDVARFLYRKVDFLHVTIFLTDNVQHAVWDAEPALRVYKLIDKNLGAFMKPENVVFLVADHGFMRIKKTVNLLAWLEKNGYYARRAPISKKAPLSNPLRKILTSEDIYKKIDIDRIKRYVPQSVLRIIRKRYQLRDIAAKQLEKITDWTRTTAIPFMNVIYTNLSAGARAKLAAALEKDLASELDAAAVAENVYRGAYVNRAPGVVLRPQNGVYLVTDPYVDDVYVSRSRCAQNPPPIGAHDPYGIFGCWGAGITNKKLDVKIYDLAPTILHIFDVPIPETMDGRVLLEMFESGTPFAKRKVRYAKIDEKERLRMRIRALKLRGRL